jgi:hypothetical protein
MARDPATGSGSADIGRAARIGLAGEFLDMVSSHTEADPNALLLQFQHCLETVWGGA